MDLNEQIKHLKEQLAARLRYKDKVVIVTGGSRGIGEGCVRIFSHEGAHVVFCDRNDGHHLEKEINSQGIGSAHYVFCDVTKEEDRKHVVNVAIEKYGRLDCLINNAGAHPPHHPIDRFSLEDFNNILQLNLVSYFDFCKLSLPHLRKTKGNIINVSSLVGHMGQLWATTYAATKGAVTSFTKALAIDEAAHHVRVNSVSPGNVWTPMWQNAIEQSPDKEKAHEAGHSAQWLGRMATIEMFLCHKICINTFAHL
eukprot:TRINITY_DN3754_c0_g4_i5.p1 TRINITY_DN3754_c0_g4~~TRINITY_DN3754_c0_g4_i5.p1  ORF type:complete len:254 (-),score=33.36 TRINITY_DN3754_c0_g4_i5:220-981(-)